MNEEKVLVFPTSIRLNASLKEELEKLAKADRRSLNSYINIVLEDHVSSVKAKKVPNE